MKTENDGFFFLNSNVYGKPFCGELRFQSAQRQIADTFRDLLQIRHFLFRDFIKEMNMICKRLERRFIIDREIDTIFHVFIPALDDNIFVFFIRNDPERDWKHCFSDLPKKIYTPHIFYLFFDSLS